MAVKVNHNSFDPESRLMRLARRLGMPRLSTAMRRLYCPVSKSAFVLEVGSGDSPYPRSDVLLDASFEDYERGGRLITDRPLVIALVNNLPFRDGVFDFSIASQIMEHLSDPAGFIQELQRVSRAGYIETPDSILEELYPGTVHRLFVTQRDGTLLITKKPSWNVRPFIAEGWKAALHKSPALRSYIRKHEGELLLKFYWSGTIPYEITNDEVDCSWEIAHIPYFAVRKNSRRGLKFWARSLVYKYAKMRYRTRRDKMDLIGLLRCVDCFASPLSRTEGDVHCPNCGRRYKMREGIPIMYPINQEWR